MNRKLDGTVQGQEKFVLCSECFKDQGLVLDAQNLGLEEAGPCPNCSTVGAPKLTRGLALTVAHRFFVAGTIHRTNFGGAPAIQFNDRIAKSDDLGDRLNVDIKTFEDVLGIHFFRYGPRLWMVGEVEPLRTLQDPTTRGPTLQRVVDKYPARVLSCGERVYRVRKNPQVPASESEYDSPPDGCREGGRLDAPDFPVLYASKDLELCLHECRVAAADELFVATLTPERDLRLLDLACLLEEEGTEFESLDMAVHMLFLAGKHSYNISQAIAQAAQKNGYDGLRYPSYFSLLRIGALPFETAYGISIRKFDSQKGRATSQVVPNIALFGRPISSGIVRVEGINRVVLRRVEYDIHFGPVGI